MYHSIHKSLANDPRITNREMHIPEERCTHRRYYVQRHVNWCSCKVYIDQIGRSYELLPVSAHCEDCAPIFAESFPLTGSFLQRRQLINILRVRRGVGAGCLICYMRERKFATVDEVCGQCYENNELEGGVLAWLYWILRGLVGADVARIIVGIVVAKNEWSICRNK